MTRIYLDIDGVLNSAKGDKIAAEKFPEEVRLLRKNMLAHKYFLYKHWDVEAVEALRFLMEKTGAEIYIHSTWKEHFSIEDFKTFFKYWNLDSSKICGIVPRYKLSSTRSTNITWHVEGERLTEDDTSACENYLVIDDIDMRNSRFGSRQICTDGKVGLTMEQAKEAVKILKTNKDN